MAGYSQDGVQRLRGCVDLPAAARLRPALQVVGGSILPRRGAAVLRPYGVLGLFFCFADAGFQGLQGEVGLLFVD
jgi:hypothetical protein